MKRREFSLTLASTMAAGSLVSTPALAQGDAPKAGTDYYLVEKRAAVDAPAGKIEVVEFFSYGCPHCFALEPLLENWVKRLPADVIFRRAPVGFNASFAAYQTLYFGLEAMGKLESMHKRVFTAIHVQRQRLDREADQVAFLNASGVDGAAFAKLSKEFHVATKSTQARKLSEAYKIDGVPALGIHGRFYTAGSLAGDHQRSLAVADFLIDRVRKNA